MSPYLSTARRHGKERAFPFHLGEAASSRPRLQSETTSCWHFPHGSHMPLQLVAFDFYGCGESDKPKGKRHYSEDALFAGVLTSVLPISC